MTFALLVALLAQAPPPEVREIYDTARTPVFVLQRACPWVRHCRGAEITGWYAGDQLRRIVLHAWTDRGKQAIEYYLRGDAAIFIYESLEYFAETAPPGVAQDGRGLPASERRYSPDSTPPAVRDLRALLDRARKFR